MHKENLFITLNINLIFQPSDCLDWDCQRAEGREIYDFCHLVSFKDPSLEIPIPEAYA